MADKPFVPVFIRTGNNYDMRAASDASGLRCEDVSLAVQSARDEVDINTITRRFGLTGELPEGVRAPVFGDFTEVTDYRTALHSIMEAEASFMAMPAEVRSRFGNDPAAFVDFCSTPGNEDELKRLGLVNKPLPPVDPVMVRVVPEPAKVVPEVNPTLPLKE